MTSLSDDDLSNKLYININWQQHDAKMKIKNI